METSEDMLDTLIETSARVLGLTIEPEWHASVRTNLEVTLRLAGLVENVALADDADPAPVFEA